jgi:hypothetical protein
MHSATSELPAALCLGAGVGFFNGVQRYGGGIRGDGRHWVLLALVVLAFGRA